MGSVFDGWCKPLVGRTLLGGRRGLWGRVVQKCALRPDTAGTSSC